MSAPRVVIVLIALAVLMGTVRRPEAQGSSDAGRDAAVATLVERAQDAIESKDHAQAAEILRRALSHAPWDVEIARTLRDTYDAGRLEPGVDERAVEGLIAALGPAFRRTETKRFVVLSDASTSWTRTRERLLERTYHEVTRFGERIGLPVVPPEHKLVVVLFAQHAAYRAFALEHDGVEAGWVAGYYASVPNHAVFYDDRTSPAFQEAHAQLDEVVAEARAAGRIAHGSHASPDAQRADQLRAHAREQRERLEEQAEVASLAKTTHEAAHLIAFNTNIQRRSRHYPFWITEGLAIAFETSNPDRRFGPSVRDEARDAQFTEIRDAGGLAPLYEFVARTEVHHHDIAHVREEYTQAYSLFTDAARYQRDELAQLFLEIARAPAGRTTVEAQREHFVHAFGDIERYERAWLKRSR